MSGSYQWRVRVSDGTGSITSSWCEFTLYDFAPPATGCASVAGDFNGDGVPDHAVSDPHATVGANADAGAVYVLDGATGSPRTITKGTTEVPAPAEAGDRFGHTLAVYDANRDGCADLAVGSPFDEPAAATADAGVVVVLLGSPAGLGRGPATVTLSQGAGGLPDTAEAGDWFGYALAVGVTSGEPFLVIGVPGEDIGTAVDAGMGMYLRGSIKVGLSQGTGAFPGPAESDDRTGFAVTASPYHFAIASPGEAIGTREFGGSVQVFTHTLTSGAPTPAASLTQDVTGVSDSAEANDEFGRSVSMVPYRPVGGAAGQPISLLVVGVPGEDSSVDDDGKVQQFQLTTTGFTELASMTQSTTGISGNSESGDYFGARVVAVNTNPAAEASPQTVMVAVGAPGEDLGTADAGEIRVFAAGTATIAADTTVYRTAASLPGSPVELELIGLTMAATAQDLLIGAPYGDGSVWAIPWSSLAAGTAVPGVTWQPGAGGLPSDVVTFGAAIA